MSQEIIYDNVFYVAVEAHVKWKIRLKKHLDGTSEEHLDPDVICRDDQCALGKWIYSDGQNFKKIPGFDLLRDTHADFHKCAAEIVRTKDSGEHNEAENILNTRYAKLSRDITSMLVRMNTAINKRSA